MTRRQEVAERARLVLARVREALASQPTFPAGIPPAALAGVPTAQGGGAAGAVARLQGRFISECLLSSAFPVPYFAVVPGLLPARFLGDALPGGLSVLGSVEEPAGGSLWYHVSLARRDRSPSYEDIARTRRVMFRGESTVLQVFPPESEHVNIHPYCLHLWECLEGWQNPPDLRQHDPVLGGLGI